MGISKKIINALMIKKVTHKTKLAVFFMCTYYHKCIITILHQSDNYISGIMYRDNTAAAAAAAYKIYSHIFTYTLVTFADVVHAINPN